MGGWRRASVLAIALGAVAVSGSRNAPIVVEQRPSQGVYSRNSKEAFLTTEQLDYIRPGYHITVNSVTIPADLRPLVDVSFFDDLNQPLDRNGQVTPGTLSASMVLALYDPATRNYVAYTTRTQTAAPPSTMVGATATQAAAADEVDPFHPCGKRMLVCAGGFLFPHLPQGESDAAGRLLD